MAGERSLAYGARIRSGFGASELCAGKRRVLMVCAI